MLTVPARFEQLGDPHAGMDSTAGSLEHLLDLAAKDEAEGLSDAPWPPHFRKMEGEAPRVAPSRAEDAADRRRQFKNKESALEGLERWKAKHPDVAKFLAVDDILIDSMRGRYSTWTRIRVNLRHVPESPLLHQKRPIRMTTPQKSGLAARRRRSVSMDKNRLLTCAAQYRFFPDATVRERSCSRSRCDRPLAAGRENCL